MIGLGLWDLTLSRSVVLSQWWNRDGNVYYLDCAVFYFVIFPLIKRGVFSVPSLLAAAFFFGSPFRQSRLFSVSTFQHEEGNGRGEGGPDLPHFTSFGLCIFLFSRAGWSERARAWDRVVFFPLLSWFLFYDTPCGEGAKGEGHIYFLKWLGE